MYLNNSSVNCDIAVNLQVMWWVFWQNINQWSLCQRQLTKETLLHPEALCYLTISSYGLVRELMITDHKYVSNKSSVSSPLHAVFNEWLFLFHSWISSGCRFWRRVGLVRWRASWGSESFSRSYTLATSWMVRDIRPHCRLYPSYPLLGHYIYSSLLKEVWTAV